MSRDAELYKDKIEVSLDGRQIFYLFFGGAVIVGLVFVLGVMVGRRVEARGHIDHARTDATDDPLAALDRLDGSPTFAKQLLAPAPAVPPQDPVDKKIEQIAAAKADAAAKAATAAKPGAKATPAPAKPAEVEAKAEAKPEAKTETKVEAKAEPKPVAKPEARVDHADKEHADKERADKEHADKERADKVADKDGKDTKDKADAKAEAKVRYTLQLSSFQDKGEAQSFLDDLKAAGFEATLTEANVDGKGTFYRVRLGNYRSLEAANDAKAELERTAKKTAQVMRL
jgi:cell division septation protein DedD